MDYQSPAQELEHFLNFIDSCTDEYRLACDIVNEEDRRLQDLLHEMEFAEDRAERNRTATRLQHSRQFRRQNKNIVKRDEQIVKFFEDQNNRSVLNRLRQLLGKQRKEEDYLNGEKVYKPRVEKR